MKGLEIGGEKHPAYPAYDQVDNVPDFGANIICDARWLDIIENDEYDHVFASNVLEHFSWTETTKVLYSWYRVLRPGGLLEIIVPDTIGIISDYLGGIDAWQHTCERLAGTQNYEGNTHLAFFTNSRGEFKKLLTETLLPSQCSVELSHKGGGITAKVYK